MNTRKFFLKKGFSNEMIKLTNFPMDVTYQIKYFRDFLVASWPSLDILMKGAEGRESRSLALSPVRTRRALLRQRAYDKYHSPHRGI